MPEDPMPEESMPEDPMPEASAPERSIAPSPFSPSPCVGGGDVAGGRCEEVDGGFAEGARSIDPPMVLIWIGCSTVSTLEETEWLPTPVVVVVEEVASTVLPPSPSRPGRSSRPITMGSNPLAEAPESTSDTIHNARTSADRVSTEISKGTTTRLTFILCTPFRLTRPGLTRPDVRLTDYSLPPLHEGSVRKHEKALTWGVGLIVLGVLGVVACADCHGEDTEFGGPFWPSIRGSVLLTELTKHALLEKAPLRYHPRHVAQGILPTYVAPRWRCRPQTAGAAGLRLSSSLALQAVGDDHRGSDFQILGIHRSSLRHGRHIHCGLVGGGKPRWHRSGFLPHHKDVTHLHTLGLSQGFGLRPRHLGGLLQSFLQWSRIIRQPPFGASDVVSSSVHRGGENSTHTFQVSQRDLHRVCSPVAFRDQTSRVRVVPALWVHRHVAGLNGLLRDLLLFQPGDNLLHLLGVLVHGRCRFLIPDLYRDVKDCLIGRGQCGFATRGGDAVSYTHLRAHETVLGQSCLLSRLPVLLLAARDNPTQHHKGQHHHDHHPAGPHTNRSRYSAPRRLKSHHRLQIRRLVAVTLETMEKAFRFPERPKDHLLT